MTINAGYVSGRHTLILSNVPRDPEVRGFVRLEQQHRDTPIEPDANGATSFFLLTDTVLHGSARTRQDSLKLSFLGSRGTIKARCSSYCPNAHGDRPAHLRSPACAALPGSPTRTQCRAKMTGAGPSLIALGYHE